jgi:hypothetical protein
MEQLLLVVLPERWLQCLQLPMVEDHSPLIIVIIILGIRCSQTITQPTTQNNPEYDQQQSQSIERTPTIIPNPASSSDTVTPILTGSASHLPVPPNLTHDLFRAFSIVVVYMTKRPPKNTRHVDFQLIIV